MQHLGNKLGIEGETYFLTLILSRNVRPAASLMLLGPGNATGCGVGSSSQFLRQGNRGTENQEKELAPGSTTLTQPDVVSKSAGLEWPWDAGQTWPAVAL